MNVILYSRIGVVPYRGAIIQVDLDFETYLCISFKTVVV